MTEPLAALAEAAGILPQYRDTTGMVHETTAETMRAVLAAMGLPSDTDEDVARHLATFETREARPLPPYLVLEGGSPSSVDGLPKGVWKITCEDGETLSGRIKGGSLALPSLPIGYHLSLIHI